MPNFRRRVVAGILGLALAIAVVACSSDDPDTTSPDDVGSWPAPAASLVR